MQDKRRYTDVTNINIAEFQRLPVRFLVCNSVSFMKKMIFIFVLLLVYGGAFAEESKEWPGGSAMHSGSLALSEKERYEEKSNEILEKIYSKVSGFHKNAIKAQVKALREYADSACMIVGASSGSGGSWPSTYAVRCESGVAYHHYINLRRALSCIEREEEKEFMYPGAKMNCLIQTLNTKFF
ncbi:hypothetical protein ACMDCT_11590 [Halomonadaceae bacterium KBTZ08]